MMMMMMIIIIIIITTTTTTTTTIVIENIDRIATTKPQLISRAKISNITMTTHFTCPDIHKQKSIT